MDPVNHPLPPSPPLYGPAEVVHRNGTAPPVVRTLYPVRPPQPNNGLNAKFFLTAALRWWKWALPAGVVLAAVGCGVIYWNFRPEYEAVRWLRIRDRAPYIAFRTDRDSGQFVTNQLELLRSPLVLGPVLENESVATLPELAATGDRIDWLRKGIQVRSVGGSEYFTVSFRSTNPQNAFAILNAVVESYENRYETLESKDSAELVQKLGNVLELQEGEVRKQREKVRNLHISATGGEDPFKPGTAIPLRPPLLTQLQGQLATAELDLKLLEASLDAAGKKEPPVASEVSDEDMLKALMAHPVYPQQAEMLRQNEARLHEHATKLVGGTGHPNAKMLAATIEEQRSQLAEIEKQVRLAALEQINSTAKLTQQAAVDDLASQLERQKLLVSFLKEQCDKEIANKAKDREETLELEFARADLARAEEVYSIVAGRLLALNTEKEAPARVEAVRLEADKPPTRPLESLPTKHLALIALAGLFAPFGLAIAWETLIRRVSSADQVQRDANLPVVGEIAQLPSRTRNLLGRFSSRSDHDLALFEESIESLRTCLVLSQSLKDARVLAVTSAVQSEGKTSVAVQLAVSIARASGRPTLLIDGDIRSPDVHRVLELRNAPGLGEVLANKSELKDALQTEWSPHVHVLSAGHIGISPHRLFGSGRFRKLIERVRERYRFVIIDTPPVLAAGEALVMAGAADATLICAMKDSTRIERLRITHQRLIGAGANPIGVVLSGVGTRSYAYRYGSYPYGRNQASNIVDEEISFS
ncbi:MAG: polysaccharide biosynthesis tyrosine autokinase [Planctomycetota bacterium]